MGLKTKKILGIDITISPKNEILEEIQKYLEKIPNPKSKIQKTAIKPLILFTPNPEIITYAQKDEHFKQVVNTAQINLPDGAGTVWAIKKLYGMELEKTAGVDFMLELVKMADKESLRIGLIGGRDGLADATAECLVSKQQNLKIYQTNPGLHLGFFGINPSNLPAQAGPLFLPPRRDANRSKMGIEVFDAPEIEVSRITYHVSGINKNDIRNTKYLILNTKEKDTQTEKYFQNLVENLIKMKIDILFVALGHPKQEYFIDRIKYHVSRIKYDKPLVLMAVGGAFDYISGRLPRAPKWMRDLGFEWLYRLIREPWRLSRQLQGAEFFRRIFVGH